MAYLLNSRSVYMAFYVINNSMMGMRMRGGAAHL